MRSVIVRVSTYGLGLLLLVGGVATTLAASVTPLAPEIDSNSIVSGLVLASGAVLILRSRARSK
jgi:hypothetical protein